MGFKLLSCLYSSITALSGGVHCSLFSSTRRPLVELLAFPSLERPDASNDKYRQLLPSKRGKNTLQHGCLSHELRATSRCVNHVQRAFPLYICTTVPTVLTLEYFFQRPPFFSFLRKTNAQVKNRWI